MQINNIYFSDSASDKRTALSAFRTYSGLNNSLYDVYTTPSRTKVSIYEMWRGIVSKMNGSGLQILSHNTNTFTLGFTFVNPENGKKCFAYITKAYNRYCEID